jgi:hypothetical protein
MRTDERTVFATNANAPENTGHIALAAVATVYIGKGTKCPSYPACK